MTRGAKGALHCWSDESLSVIEWCIFIKAADRVDSDRQIAELVAAGKLGSRDSGGRRQTVVIGERN
jgi:hypothetical protein